MKSTNDIPVIGNQYHFFDDGKIRKSRHYIATVVDVIKHDDIDSNINEIWKESIKECNWLYSNTTDYFVKATIPDYDENFIWFVRTKDGGWFSLDINNFWQSGRLDIDGKIYKSNKQYL